MLAKKGTFAHSTETMSAPTLQCYWLIVDVALAEDLQVGNGPDCLCGFYQEIGCTASSRASAIAQARDEIVFGKREWLPIRRITITHLGVIAEGDKQREIFEDADICDSLRQSPDKAGVWFATGKAFYAPAWCEREDKEAYLLRSGWRHWLSGRIAFWARLVLAVLGLRRLELPQICFAEEAETQEGQALLEKANASD